MGAPAEHTCRGCRHLYVTYRPARPWGCRALGFESTRMPSAVVRDSSGEDCRLREPSERPRAGARR